MTITMTITIKAVDPKDNAKGAGVLVMVKFDPPLLPDVPPVEGAAWVGMCNAINAYQRSHGNPRFDCFNIMSPVQ